MNEHPKNLPKNTQAYNSLFKWFNVLQIEFVREKNFCFLITFKEWNCLQATNDQGGGITDVIPKAQYNWK